MLNGGCHARTQSAFGSLVLKETRAHDLRGGSPSTIETRTLLTKVRKDAMENLAASSKSILTNAKAGTSQAVIESLSVYFNIKRIVTENRLEVISHPQLIEAYVRIRTTKNNDFINVFAQSDEGFKEEKRREKCRLRDQLRRVKKAEDRVRQQATKKPPVVETSTASQAKFTQDEMQCLRRAWTHEDEQVLQAFWSENPVSLAQRTVGDICPSIQEDEPDLHMEEQIALKGLA
uniref:Uncharacterized protein n=1 Tax=Ditylenchus dipsaci TaxID=166011 RepID=A0A915ESC1_9BILA